MSASTHRIETWERLLLEALKDNGVCSWVVRCFNQIESTMDQARLLSDEVGPDSPALVMAARQTSGRGRQGRKWVSPAEGFFATYVFKSVEDFNPSGFTLAISCAVRQTLMELGCECALKWPNDVLSYDGRKLCGILVESLSAGAGRLVLCGIGLNIAGEPAEAVDSVSVQTLTGRTLSPVTIGERLGRRLFTVWRDFTKEGFPPFRDLWLENALFRGRTLRIDTGHEVVEGIFSGVSLSGALILHSALGAREISSGHVTVL